VVIIKGHVFEPREVSYGSWDGIRQGVTTEIKILQARQLSDVRRDGADDAAVGEVEDGEEREVTEVGGELSLEGNIRKNQSSDALPPPAARDADPAAEGHVLSPAMAKDAERVGELGFEGKQRGEVGAIAWRWSGGDNHDYCCREQKGDRNYKKRTAGKKSQGDDG